MVPGAAAAASAASAAAASALNTTWRRLGRHYSSSSSSNSGGVDRRLLKSITELYGDDDRARVHDANECALSSSSSSLADAADTVDARDGDRAESSSANVDPFLTKFSSYRKLSALETPRLLLHRYALRQNIDSLKRTIKEKELSHIALRPHAKAHKCPTIAQLQLQSIVDQYTPKPHVHTSGVSCQKVSEAEAVADPEYVNDILITNEVVCRTKLKRLAGLIHVHNIAVSIVVDHPTQIQLLQSVGEEEGVEIGVLVDVNVGQNRCGVDTPEEALELAKLISEAPSLNFIGIQAYHGAAQHIPSWQDKAEVIKGVAEKALAVKTYLKEHGNLECQVVTGGGTGSFLLEAESGVFTEVQPGSYIFNDVAYSHVENMAEFEHSLFVLSTVISRNEGARRCVLDAGMKAISFDSGPPEVFSLLPKNGEVIHLGSVARPFRNHNISAVCGGDEHTILDFSKEQGIAMPQIGSKVMLIPGHCDPTVNLYNNFTVVEKGEAIDVWRISGRGPGL